MKTTAEIKNGDMGKLFHGLWCHDEIIETCQSVQITEIEDDGTIWACNEEGEEFEINKADFVKD